VLALGSWPAATATAALSPPLLAATVNAAAVVAAGGAAASAVSPDVAALTEGMVKVMFFRKLQFAAIVLLAIAGGGAGLALALSGPSLGDAREVVEQPAPQERPGPGADAGAKVADAMGRPIHTLLGHT